MQIAVVGIDLGKNNYSIVGLDAVGAVVLRRRMRRAGAAGRIILAALQAQGHEVRLMPPEYVRPYVKSQKNDDRDAEAIAKAATRPTMRFVALKSEAQLDVQSLLVV